MNLKNKIFFTLFFFLLFVLLLNFSCVFAAFNPITKNVVIENNLSLPSIVLEKLELIPEYSNSNYDYYVCTRIDGRYYALFINNSYNFDFSLLQQNSNNVFWLAFPNEYSSDVIGSSIYTKYMFDTTSNNFVIYNEIGNYPDKMWFSSCDDLDNNTLHFSLYSNRFNYNIYTGYNFDTLVFQPPVTEPETPEKQETAVTIPALETAEQIPQAMTKTAKIVIPIGLIVLSIGLLIYLIKRVIFSMQ